MAAPIVEVLENDTDVANRLCDIVIDHANKAIESDGFFAVGFSGGSLVKFLCAGLPTRKTDWAKWRIFFCDERHVSYDDPECTYAQYRKGLEGKVTLTEDSNIFPINPNVSVEKAAEEYVQKVRKVFPGNDLPSFHLLLLGMGPDGHTCSLFPGHQLLKETERMYAAISDSPKPPPCRITMTYPVINNCKCAIFASCGAGKADILQRVLEGNEADPLPAASVRPTKGDVMWLLDKAAAAKLKSCL
ncbi:hypothetical protein FSP39_017427 [Pinctada imbricata]|uniref:6-phosphogluconolactonase n=1 Tax=Pinctada imbricata TaxID=66713 RepID=A0AA89BZE2_PINIB|nr:hypothetical protein FSP39_017427 [Pinctada imbricata]